MSQKTYDEVLEHFKEQEEEEPEVVAAISGDNALQNGLLAWRSVPILKSKDKNSSCDENLRDSEKWNWLWGDDFSCDWGHFASVSGVKEHEVFSLFTRLKGLRLIYPDGSVNKYALQFLRGVIMKQLKKIGR